MNPAATGETTDTQPRLRGRTALVRATLAALLGFGALNAFAGGYFGMSGAEGVPREWLEGSPFVDYFVPGVVLFFVVGGALFIASLAVLRQRRSGRLLAFAAAGIVLIWLSIQVSIIGYVSWMQPTTAVAAAVIAWLAWLLPK